MTTAGRRRFVLLDRDGTINVERGHLTDPDRIELIDGAAEALRDLAARGFGLVVVTNQSPIGRGMMDRARLAEIHERLTRELAARGARLDGIYFCPHHPDAGCACRKPATGMAEQASAEHGFEPSECFVVGDSEGDIGLARALGAIRARGPSSSVGCGSGASSSSSPSTGSWVGQPGSPGCSGMAT